MPNCTVMDAPRLRRLAALTLHLAALAAVVAARPEAQAAPATGDAAMRATELRCEFLADPLAIDERSPRLSWRLEGPGRGLRQTAYRVLVASSPERLARGQGDLWDTDKVPSSETVGIPYNGRPLVSRDRCYWRVMTWDQAGKPSRWSRPATWTMGLLLKDDWEAKWISHRDTRPLHTSRSELYLPPPRQFRKEFTAGKPVKRATVYATALGLYDLELNGKRVGDAVFTPGWTDYKKRLYYQAFDVTPLVRSGANALGATVAEGWYSGYVGYGLLVGYGPHRTGRYFYGKTPALLAQLELEYADGSREIVGTGPDWKVTDRGPVREADFLMGEVHDARQELSGWSSPGFSAAGWEPAILATENGSTKAPFFDSSGQREVELGFTDPPRYETYPGPPVRATEELKTVRISEPKPGTYIFDLGQNIAGVARLKVKGPAGTRVQLRFGEMLHPDGRLMTENLRRARATDAYILRGDPAGETWQPRFTYHGFQFVEVTGYPGQPGPDAITGVVLHSDTPLTSTFESSDPVVNKVYQNAVWTQRGNFVELPTDCPQRDERLGWMGDAQIYVRAATYHADVASFFNKWLREVEEAQLPNGAYPDYAPYPMFHGGPTGYGTAWTDAGIICPYTIWKVYGDRRIIERFYPSMARFIQFRQERSPDFRGVNQGNTWGDWLSLGEQTPIEFVDAAYFAQSARLMSEMADALGWSADAAKYRRLYQAVRGRFQADYQNPDGTLKVDTQTAYTLALYFDLVPPDLRQEAGDRLAARVEANQGRMATGFLGTRHLLPVLTATGHQDLALRLLQSREFPSWGYEVVNGATSIWERWNSFVKGKGFGDASMNSFSHYSFGAVTEWMFQSLAGIETDGPGFRRIIVRPGPPTALIARGEKPIDQVKAEYRSIHGPIRSEWKLEAGRFNLSLDVPPNTTATVYLPAAPADGVTEGGKPLTQAEGVKLLRTEGDRAVLEVGSGSYRFTSNPGPVR